MPVKTLRLEPLYTEAEMRALGGEFLGEEYIKHFIDSDADVYKEDGSALVHFRKRQVSETDGVKAFKALYNAATNYDNRGLAAGKLEYHGQTAAGEISNTKAANVGDVRFSRFKKDGTVSKVLRGANVPSGIVGAFDRSTRYPYCRLSQFNNDSADKFAEAMPFIKQVNEVFKQHAPERYAAQLAECQRTHPDYVIDGTAFTTITVNRTWRTAMHTDRGDLRAGFGVLSVLAEGRYDGCYFLLPKYGVAVNMQHRDVLLAEVHEWHCNTPIKPISKYFTRLSTVFYFRRKIVGCKSIPDELEIARRRQLGTKLYQDFDGDFPT